MTPQDFAFLARALKLRSGLSLTPDKQHLIEARLGPVARRNGLADLHELVWALRRAEGDALLAQVSEAMADEDAVFFRDRAPFDNLAEHLVPAVLRQATARGLLRIWSAGCGTGQEPYSIAMRLLEMRPRLASWRVEIVATDLSEPALKQASPGRYNQFEVQRGLPIELLLKYFRKTGWHWQIDEAVRAMVAFRCEDLLAARDDPTRASWLSADDPHPIPPPCRGRVHARRRHGSLPPDRGETEGGQEASAGDSPRSESARELFDIVFCRNVLLHLDAAARGRALDRIAAQLRPGGFLVLGLAETALAAGGAFAPVAGLRGVFARVGEGHRAPLRPSGTVIPLHAARAG